MAVDGTLVLRSGSTRRSVGPALVAAAVVLAAVAAATVVIHPGASTRSTGAGVTVTRAWTRNLGTRALWSADAPGGLTVVATVGGTAGLVRLTALDRATGGERWHRVVSGTISEAVAPGDGLLVVDTNGRVGVYSLRNGRPLYEQNLSMDAAYDPPVAPLVVRHIAYVATYNGLVAIDLRTHLIRWQQFTLGSLAAQPVLRRGTLHITATFPTEPPSVGFEGVDAKTGVLTRHFEIPGTAISAPAVGRRITAASVVGDRDAVWTIDSTGFESYGGFAPGGLPAPVVEPPVVAGGTIITVATDGTVAAAQVLPKTDPPFGVRWRHALGDGWKPTIARSGSQIVAAAGTVAAFGPDGSTRWTAPPRDASLVAAPNAGVVVVTSRFDNEMYVIDAHDGHIVKTVRDGTSQTAVTLQRDAMVTASDRGLVTGYRITRR